MAETNMTGSSPPPSFVGYVVEVTDSEAGGSSMVREPHGQAWARVPMLLKLHDKVTIIVHRHDV